MTPKELFAAVGMDRKGRGARMRRMGHAIVAEWASQAHKHGNMRSTLGPYKRAIAIRSVTENTVIVELPGRKFDQQTEGREGANIARMMEFGLGASGIGGSGPVDMRRWLLTRESPGSRGKIQPGANGPYRNVPFKPTVKQIRSMGGSSAVKDARELAATHVRGGSWRGPRLAAGYTAIVNNPNTKIPHTTDRLHGLRRMQNKKGRTTRYITFRRASWAGNPWMHRGVVARKIVKRVVSELPRLWLESS